MSSRTAGANRAIREAWGNEKRLVLEGKGTRDWTDEQQRQIKEKGKAYDSNGRAYEGQHMKSVSAHPEYQDDARNIQLLSREEHLAAHAGSWMNPTNGYYDPVAKTMSDFGGGPPQPRAEVPLTNPLYNEPLDTARPFSSEARCETVDALADTNTAPKGKVRHRAQTLRRGAHWLRRGAVQMLRNPLFWTAVGSAALVVSEAAANRDRSENGGSTINPLTQPPESVDPELDDDTLSEGRKSPDEHIVSGYTRKNGTTVQPYPRGGNKD